MGLCQVSNMDIVPYTCSVGCGIIRSENTYMVTFSVGHLKDKRYKVAFGIMGLSYHSAFVGSACIEISQ